MKTTAPDEIVIGYKATDKDMICRPKEGVEFKFELGKWYTHEGDLSLCNSGFHFCEFQSGPFCYYPEDSRIFKIEAKEVLKSVGPGADLKHVCRHIRLIEEIVIGGHRNTGDRNTGGRNTGDRNTGDSNTGHSNTGYSNTGDRNTGDSNTGDRNTGYRNTGHSNTGYRNTGDSNTGYRNTGDSNTGHRNTGGRNTGDSNTGGRNTGDRNTGDSNTGDSNTGYRNTGGRNTGDSNTGDRNTGDSNTGYRNTGGRNTGDRNTGDSNTGGGNAGDYHSGYFNIGDAPFIVFGKKANRKNFDFYLASRLSEKLMSDEDFDCTEFLALPNATKAKIKKLHKEHIRLRSEANK